MTDSPAPPPFYRIGPDRPVSPIVLSVPHAGRAYSPALLRAARVPVAVLEALEDRLVDRLIWRAVAEGATAIVATAPRAEIDLNRDEREIDPSMVAPPPSLDDVMATSRTRGGLGLVPARLAGAGSLWRGRIGREELHRRVESIHRPYHQALATALGEAKAQFGAAILLDCHSMPPRPQQAPGAGVIFGDRHGATMAPHLVGTAVAVAQEHGVSAACNQPYAGGHIIERHARPAAGVHALQIEIDRSLYLNAALREPGPRFDSVARLLGAISTALGAAVSEAMPIAAE